MSAWPAMDARVLRIGPSRAGGPRRAVLAHPNASSTRTTTVHAARGLRDDRPAGKLPVSTVERPVRRGVPESALLASRAAMRRVVAFPSYAMVLDRGLDAIEVENPRRVLFLLNRLQ